MSSLFIKIVFFLSVFSCTNNSASEEGYLFVDIANIYHNEKKLTIVNKENATLISFESKNISIEGKTYEIINDEHLYKKLIGAVSYYPEYDLFILEARKLENGDYSVNINNSKGIIKAGLYKEILTFKTPKEYVLDSYPNPTKDNPLRISSDESSDIISNYEDYTFIPVEIVGDWLKVKDDKECYSGEYPSEKDIIGWIRWRKDGKLIIDIRHIC